MRRSSCSSHLAVLGQFSKGKASCVPSLLAVLPITPPPAAGTERLVRFDKRDAAGCLLALHLSPEEAAAEPAVQWGTLLELSNCSHAWLKGEVPEPTQGYSQQELAAGLHRLALGEEQPEAEGGAQAAGEQQAGRAAAGAGAGAGDEAGAAHGDQEN